MEEHFVAVILCQDLSAIDIKAGVAFFDANTISIVQEFDIIVFIQLTSRPIQILATVDSRVTNRIIGKLFAVVREQLVTPIVGNGLSSGILAFVELLYFITFN